MPGRPSSLPTIAVALAPRFGGNRDKFGSVPLNQGPEMGFPCHTLGFDYGYRKLGEG